MQSAQCSIADGDVSSWGRDELWGTIRHPLGRCLSVAQVDPALTRWAATAANQKNLEKFLLWFGTQDRARLRNAACRKQ